MHHCWQELIAWIAGVSTKHTAVALGVLLGLVATVATAALAFLVYTKPEAFTQRLPGLFQRRQTANDVDYQELGPTTDREPLVG